MKERCWVRKMGNIELEMANIALEGISMGNEMDRALPRLENKPCLLALTTDVGSIKNNSELQLNLSLDLAPNNLTFMQQQIIKKKWPRH